MAAALALVTLTVAARTSAEEGAKPGSAPGDRVMTHATERVHPTKKRGLWRIRTAVDDSEDGLDRFQKWLHDRDVLLGFDVAFYDQYASRVREGRKNAATFAWQLFADYELVDWKDAGELHVTGTFLGTIGADYDARTDPLSTRIGSISVVNGNVYPDAIAVDELYAHYVSEHAKYVVALGKLDMSYFFDTNRVANDAYRQFTAFTLENDISIPFPIYGGFGLLGRWNATEDIYVMLGVTDASSDERIPWGTVADGAWWQILEAGFGVEPTGLGTGNYRVTAWHSDAGPGSGVGIGINIDQNLGLDWLIGFLRAGIGNPAQTNVRTAISGGVSFQGPFGRKNDEAGIGFSWADPSAGDRDETFAETFYRLALTRRLSLSPGLQIVVNPSDNPADDVSVVGGLRVLWML